jgi:hypothetical protein
VTLSSGIGKWCDNTREIHSLNLQSENPRSGFNWLCLTIFLLKTLFCECGLSSRREPVIYDQAMMVLVYYFLLGGITFGEDKFPVLSWWCLIRCYKE